MPGKIISCNVLGNNIIHAHKEGMYFVRYFYNDPCDAHDNSVYINKNICGNYKEIVGTGALERKNLLYKFMIA
ncbi:hypothetical protein SAMN05216390_102358 [Lachnospiraceae bacterium KH1T2]|nr:hypothetical protein SAMN05216390_102358 [Lachnospiraceae bacterium KH1T2]